MRITENRLRRAIRQVIKESVLDSMSIVEELKLEIMNLGKTEAGNDLYPGPGGDENLIVARCEEIEKDIKEKIFPTDGGKLYEMVRLACEEQAPGSSLDPSSMMRCLQSDKLENVTESVIQKLNLR